MGKNNRLTIYILIAMVLGLAVGWFVHENSSPEFITSFAANVKLLTTIFLRLVQMIIAPLVFSTLVVGIAKLGDLKTVGRVGGKALLWFVTASLVSLLLGMVLVNFFKPGAVISMTAGDASGALPHSRLLSADGGGGERCLDRRGNCRRNAGDDDV